MFDTLFPPQLDAEYRGHKVAPWLLAIVVGVRIAQSLFVFANASYVLAAADRIPFDRFGPAAAQTVVFAFAGWKVDRLLIAMLCLLAFVRYRSMIPLMFVVMLLQQLGRDVVAYFYPYVSVGPPPAHFVNMALLGLILVGLPLSLWRVETRNTARRVKLEECDRSVPASDEPTPAASRASVVR